jgi:hypothetical protein
LSNTASSYGGAICGSTNFNYCNFSRNYSTLEGGAIRTFISYSNINHCLVNDNNSNQGGGIWGYASIINSTIVNNNATLAGGIYGHCSEFVNNIVAFNIGSGIHQCSNYPLEYSDFYGNTGGNFSGIIPAGLGNIVSVNANGDSCDIFHNIYQDPLFVNQPGEDFHLTEGSPCIDAGDPASPLDPDSTIADIGAYFFDQRTFVQDLVIAFLGNDITLNWGAIPGAVSYNVYRSTEPYFDIGWMLPIASINENSYIDTGALTGSKYFYRVTWE